MALNKSILEQYSILTDEACCLGPVLLQRSNAVTILSANGSEAFKESCAPIG